jgi:hypothetical protein
MQPEVISADLCRRSRRAKAEGKCPKDTAPASEVFEHSPRQEKIEIDRVAQLVDGSVEESGAP